MKVRTNRKLLLVSLVFGLSACTTISDNFINAPEVKLSNVQVLGLGFDGQTFMLSFDVANTNPFPLPVRNVSYGLKLDGRRFASGETASEFTVPADGSAQFAISVELNLLATAPQLLSIVRDGVRQDIPYELDGSLGVDIPLTPALRYRTSGSIRLNSGSY